MGAKSLSMHFMSQALDCARKAFDENEVPVGAVVVKKGRVIGKGWNQVISQKSVASHAEINAILAASEYLKNHRLIDCDLYVTLEPCHMCAKAIIDARIKSLYFATMEPKSGAILSVDTFLDHTYQNHRVAYHHGYMQSESADLLKYFFKSKRH